MINLSPPRFVSRIFTTPTWHVPNGESRVFLTFDDGPTPGVTDWVLDELAIRGAKASFFCLGRNAERYPDLLARIREEGHTVGNHTYSHLRGYGQNLRDYYNDVLEANRLLATDLFRPPYGRITPKQLSFIAQHFRVVLWSVLSMDYSRHVSPQRCLAIVTKNTRVGDIVVFHDSHKAERNLRYALPRALDALQARGLVLSALGHAELKTEALRSDELPALGLEPPTVV